MIIFSVDNKNLFSTYNKYYSENPSHFEMANNAVKFINDFIKEINFSEQEFIALEIGCGQGEYLAEVAKAISIQKQMDNCNYRFIGVDASEIAIYQCNNKYPELEWSSSTFQEFALSNVGCSLKGHIDLIFTKGGITYLANQEDYIVLVEQINQMLKPGGIFAYYYSKDFQAKWLSEKKEKGWTIDPLVVINNIIGQEKIFDVGNSLMRVYKKESTDT